MTGLYEELKSWQSGIAAIVGFFALMLGALWNFHLNRRRDADLRRHEMLSVATALYGEVLLLREEIARVARFVANVANRNGTFDQEFLKNHTPREPIFYQALASKFGILPYDLIIGLTRFHEHYQQARANLPLLVEEDHSVTYSPLVVLEPAEKAVVEVEPTLRKIEQLAGIEQKATEPDLGKTRSVSEWERERFEMAFDQDA